MGRVMGRRVNGELVVEDAGLPHMGANGTSVIHWPTDQPLIVVAVGEKGKSGDTHFARWHDSFIHGASVWVKGDTPRKAALNLFAMHCTKYFLPVNAPLPLFKCWIDGKKGSNLFQIVVTNIEDVTSPTGHQWRACFDGEWTWLRATGDTKEEAVAKLRAENPGLVTKPQVMVLNAGTSFSAADQSWSSLGITPSGTMLTSSSSAVLTAALNVEINSFNWKHQNKTVSTDLPAAPEPIKPRRGGPSRVRKSVVL